MGKRMWSAALCVAVLSVAGGLLLNAQSDATGVWMANDVPYAPWTMELKQTGTTLTGSMQQNGALRGPAEIYEGTIKGTAVSFKVTSPDGAREITFTGVINGNEMTLTRSTRIITNASPGGTGLFGTNAAPQFTLRRAPAGASADASGRQHWEATGVAYAPWTFDLKIDGTTVTGVAGQGRLDPAGQTVTTLTGPFEIFDGRVAGNTMEFKLKTADGGRIVTFRGVRDGDKIAFTRSVEVVRGDPGRDGILGASGATQFTAVLGAAVPAAQAPPPARPATVSPASGPSGRWQVTAVPNTPWIFEFTEAGTLLTGTIQQGGSTQNFPVSIAAGKVDGTTISFKILTPDAERLIAFSGRVNGGEISFIRTITVLAGGGRGGNDLYGGSAPLQFIARRVASNSR